MTKPAKGWTSLAAALTGLICVVAGSAPTPASAAIVAVACVNPGDLQAQVNLAGPFDTLNVSGTCTEEFLTLNSSKNGMILDGGGTAEIHDNQAPPAGATAVTVRGATQVQIRNFHNLTSNQTDGTGVFVNDGASARVEGNTITGNNVGISVSRNAQATINNNTVTDNPGVGILVSETASVRIGLNFPVAAPNTVQSNGSGIQVQRSSTARVIGNNVSNNAQQGIFVTRGSQADIASNTIANNAQHGIVVSRNSNVVLGADTGTGPLNDPNSGTNTGFGIACAINSSADGVLGTLNGTTAARGFDGTCVDSLLPAIAASGLGYTPIVPCRIVDTRNAGGPIGGNAQRSFVVTGTQGFDAQGGAPGGCGVPQAATAAMLNLVAVGPAGFGDLRAWPFGQPVPLASVLNYGPGFNIANGLAIPLCDPVATACPFQVTLQADVSAADVVIDVVGYFR